MLRDVGGDRLLVDMACCGRRRIDKSLLTDVRCVKCCDGNMLRV